MPNELLQLDTPEQAAPVPSYANKGTLILHCGGTPATWEELCAVPLPAATRTHHPLAHDRYVAIVRDTLSTLGYDIARERHALNKEGQHYFGLLNLAQKDTNAPYDFVLGLRNSHDKSVSARVALGTSVFVCDNLSFSGEITLARKHTSNMEADLAQCLVSKLGQLNDIQLNYAQRVESYRGFELTDKDAKSALFDLVRLGVLSSQRLMDAWEHWERPPFVEFETRDMWSLFNGVTHVLKSMQSMDSVVTRTRRLHAACDGWTGARVHALEADIVMRA